MSFVDPIGDMITRIRNAQMRALSKVSIPSSKLRAKILDVLKHEGYISDYKLLNICLLYTSPSPRDVEESRMPSSA